MIIIKLRSKSFLPWVTGSESAEYRPILESAVVGRLLFLLQKCVWVNDLTRKTLLFFVTKSMTKFIETMLSKPHKYVAVVIQKMA